MVLIDFDKLFEKYVKNYVSKNKIVPKDDEFEDLIVELYDAFEKESFEELGGKTPLSYYEDPDADYGKLIKEHYEKGLEISEYFMDSAVKCAKDTDLLPLIDSSLDEDIVIPAIDILEKRNSKAAFDKYIDILFDENTDRCIVDRIVEVLDVFADEVSLKILDRLPEKGPFDSAFAEILSYCAVKTDRIRDVLIRGLETSEKIPEYCYYLINYGDESVVDELEEFAKIVADKDDFKEINIAIETLGGSAVPDEEYDFGGSYLTLNVGLEKKKDGDKDKR